jgi:hypothetical protein
VIQDLSSTASSVRAFGVDVRRRAVASLDPLAGAPCPLRSEEIVDTVGQSSDASADTCAPATWSPTDDHLRTAVGSARLASPFVNIPIVTAYRDDLFAAGSWGAQVVPLDPRRAYTTHLDATARQSRIGENRP